MPSRSTVTSPPIGAASLASASAGTRVPGQPVQGPAPVAPAFGSTARLASVSGSSLQQEQPVPALVGVRPDLAVAAGAQRQPFGAGVPETPRKPNTAAQAAPPETPRARLPTRDPSLTKEQRLARLAAGRPGRTVTLIRPPVPPDEASGCYCFLCTVHSIYTCLILNFLVLLSRPARANALLVFFLLFS